jgi:hydroxymethyl cephem carbamoyltransferase
VEDLLRVLSFKPGHDGTAAFIAGKSLVFSLEAEKDSQPRFGELGARTVLEAIELAPSVPDVIALGGWHEHVQGWNHMFRAGYSGLELGRSRPIRLLGNEIQLFTSSHERSHIFMTASMHCDAPLENCALLVWEGGLGAFYRWRGFGSQIQRHHVMSDPGGKYAAVFALADPSFPSHQSYPRLEDAGKMMALAAFGRNLVCQKADRKVIEGIIRRRSAYPFRKSAYSQSGLHNCGVDTERFWAAAHHASELIFGAFYRAACELFDEGVLPLLISGGCGLNCDWNERWRRSGHFSSVFVPPCTNDSGSAIGTAVDAMFHAGLPPRIDWSVFSGPDFCDDAQPDLDRWTLAPLDFGRLAERLSRGDIVAWVQGRCEIGPRALGHRSLLASPLDPDVRTRLNAVKGRESYRPIAPCCRLEDVHRWFDMTLSDEYMLYFGRVLTERLPAVTHVDGTARVQAVNQHDNARLHHLLGEVEARTGYGVLCNTSLNFPGRGFINRTSDLIAYCDDRSVDMFVLDGRMYERA